MRKWTFTVIAAVFSVPLAVTSEWLGLQYNLWTSPGAYVWGLLHRDTECGFLGCIGSSFGTMFAVDSICWFILLYLAGFIIARARKKNGADQA